MRDQVLTPFGRELGTLVAAVRGARAAALVDVEGETVDYSADLPPYDVRVMAAHLRLVLDAAQTQPALRSTVFAVIRTSRAGFVVHDIAHGYALVLWLGPEFRWSRALRQQIVRCGERLADEAGWPPAQWAPSAGWHAIDVSTDETGRPWRIRRHPTAPPETVEIVGRYVEGIGRARCGWRIRLTSGRVGLEATVVSDDLQPGDGSRREAPRWWIDDPLPSTPSAAALPAVECATAPREGRTGAPNHPGASLSASLTAGAGRAPKRP